MSSSAAVESGMKVDLEMKAFVVVAVYALMKVFKAQAENFLFLTSMRGIFVLGHVYFIYIYLFTNHRISKSTSRNAEEKAKAKSSCLGVLRSILIRAAIMGFVHYRTKMMPPLLITVFMGFFSMIENDFYYQIMYSKLPGLFELLYR